jgi:hypothetical protein
MPAWLRPVLVMFVIGLFALIPAGFYSLLLDHRQREADHLRMEEAITCGKVMIVVVTNAPPKLLW